MEGKMLEYRRFILHPSRIYGVAVGVGVIKAIEGCFLAKGCILGEFLTLPQPDDSHLLTDSLGVYTHLER